MAAAVPHPPSMQAAAPQVTAPIQRIEDDILGSAPVAAMPPSPSLANRTAGTDTSSEAYFRDVYSQFIAAKQQCGEPTAGVTFEKFSEKLRKNREELITRTGCREVAFSVYVKDGKAALKASPVRG